MPHERLRPSFVFDEERLKHLRQIAPEAFADEKINWDVLKETLGEHLEEEGAEAEHFGLFWPGKRESRKIASIPSKGTLIPVKGEGIDEETTKNIFIEGENLEVLKLFQKSYVGKIKMIYIDPPYNTGNDFIYDDNFTQPIDEYLKLTGQIDEEGKSLTTNKRSDGRFHSKWLSMMYPRLRLARSLLSDNGVIFISIDDNEIDNLRSICNEIFGEENFVGALIRQTIEGGKQDSQSIQNTHEYCLVYTKSGIGGIGRRKIEDFSHYTKEDKYLKERGRYYLKPLENGGLGYIASLDYPIVGPDGKEIYPGGMHGDNGYRWVWSPGRYEKAKELDLIEFVPARSGKGYKVYYKIYQNFNSDGDMVERTSPFKTLYLDGFTNRQGVLQLKNIFDGNRLYDYPKPISFIKELIMMGATNVDEAIILDFFSGSCTTAHAVLEMVNNSSKYKFIMVQIPEPCEKDSEAYKGGYKNISEIGKERIRRVIKKLRKESKKNARQDFGFKVFKLDKSNFKQWQNYDGSDLNQLKDLFEKQGEPLVDGWKSENLLVEIMLQEGFPLDSDVLELKDHKKNKVIQVSSSFCQHKLLISFDKKIAQDTIDNLKIEGEDIFVCLDSALTDEQKVTLSDKGFLKTI